MNNVLEITNKKLEKNILTIEAHVKPKLLASEPLLVIKTEKIIEYISEEYNIVKIVKPDSICNSTRGGQSQHGTWVFQVKKKRKTKTSSESAPVTTQVKKSAPDKKLTKTSIRGRMSKLAKTKLSTKEE